METGAEPGVIVRCTQMETGAEPGVVIRHTHKTGAEPGGVRHTQMETGAEPGVFVVNQSNVIALLRVNKMLMNQIKKVVPGVTCVTI